MKRTYPLTKGKHAPERVIDAIKSNVRQHIKRERLKELPIDKDYWDFECKVGVTEETAKSVHLSEIGKAIDQAAAESTIGKIFVTSESVAKKRNPLQQTKDSQDQGVNTARPPENSAELAAVEATKENEN